jgi:hypothetical protein
MANFREKKVEHFQDWLNLALSVLLFISPWVLGFAGEQQPAWNAWACAIIIAVFSVAALVNFAEWEEWVNLVVGLWLVISPWILQFSAVTSAMWTAVIIGVIVAVLAAWEIWSARHPMTRATA